MSNVYRICSSCGKQTNELERRFCPDCGADSHAELAVAQSSLAVAAGKAAVPLLVGTVSLALRFGIKLLQSRTAISALHNANKVPSLNSKSSESGLSKQNGRRIHIRSAWSISNSDGNWKKGKSEQIIDIDE